MKLNEIFKKDEINCKIVNHDYGEPAYHSKLGYVTVYKYYMENENLQLTFREIEFDIFSNVQVVLNNLFYPRHNSCSKSVFKKIKVLNKKTGELIYFGSNSEEASRYIESLISQKPESKETAKTLLK